MTTSTIRPWPAPIKALADKWPSAIVTRERVDEFSGGLLHSRTLANIDSDPDRQGPPRMKMGRKVAYAVTDLCDWLAQRVQVVG